MLRIFCAENRWNHWLFAITETGSSADIQTFLLVEVTLQQTLESLAVAGLVASHLMNSVVDSVEVESLGALSQIELAGGCAVLSVNTHLEVLLGGVGYDLAEQLSKLCSALMDKIWVQTSKSTKADGVYG